MTWLAYVGQRRKVSLLETGEFLQRPSGTSFPWSLEMGLSECTAHANTPCRFALNDPPID